MMRMMMRGCCVRKKTDSVDRNITFVGRFVILDNGSIAIDSANESLFLYVRKYETKYEDEG
jgi:hypothetical protein